MFHYTATGKVTTNILTKIALSLYLISSQEIYKGFLAKSMQSQVLDSSKDSSTQ